MEREIQRVHQELALGHTVVTTALANLLLARGLITSDEIETAVLTCLSGVMRTPEGGPLTEAVTRSFLSGLQGPISRP